MNGVGRVPTVLQCSEAHVELKSSTLSKVSRMNQGANVLEKSVFDEILEAPCGDVYRFGMRFLEL